MPDSSLRMLLDEVRSKTLRRLDGLTEPQALWTPPGLQNSILWHAGHSYMLQETLVVGAVGEERHVPAGWYELFSWESRPALIRPQQWPSLARVIERLKAQHDRLRILFETLTVDQLSGPAHPSFGRSDHSLRYFCLHGLHDEACHSGEIWLLRKLQGAMPAG